MNEKRQEWGDQAFYQFVDGNAQLSSRDFVRLLLQALDRHKGGAEQHDDITVTTFRITGG
jgi:serine phosphatase RsbU (regulator of sigma subunit)